MPPSQSICLRRLLIYRNHIFPQIRKPIRSVSEFLLLKNPDLDKLKVTKMTKLLDEEEKKRLIQQKDAMNEEINLELERFERCYVNRFHACPDYHEMLFGYARIKAEIVRERVKDERKREGLKGGRLFWLQPKQVSKLAKSLINNQVKKQEDSKLGSQEQDSSQSSEHLKDKVLLDTFRTLSGSQKLTVYKIFFSAYKQFLMAEEEILRMVTDQKIYFLKPFFLTSPVENFQSKNPQLTLEQSTKILATDPSQRDQASLQFKKLLSARVVEVKQLEKRYNAEATEIWKNLKKQYTAKNRFSSFYEMIKSF